jgi:hypothetical protein
MLHKNIPLGEIHYIHNWEVADAAALAALVPIESDRGKLAWQLDTNEFFFLANHVGPVWVGAIGITGAAGADGFTILNGIVAPTTEGVDGDFYIDTVLVKIHGPKAAGTWPAGVDIKGIQGDPGLNGRTILHGAVAPTTEGEDDDFYINTATLFIYGPKAAGVWPAGVDLNGADGTNGADGIGVPAGGATGTVLTKVSAADNDTAWVAAPSAPIKVIPIACSDETTALTAGTAKVTFRMPYAMTLTAVRASLTTAQASGASLVTVDINEAGVSILSTKLTIDNTEKTSTTAVTAAVMSDSSLADDAEITIDIDLIGDGTAKGLKVYLIGT